MKTQAQMGGMILKKCNVWVWTGVKSLRIWASGGLLGNMVLKF
jgi:hypothetical protein